MLWDKTSTRKPTVSLKLPRAEAKHCFSCAIVAAVWKAKHTYRKIRWQFKKKKMARKRRMSRSVGEKNTQEQCL